MPEVERGSNNKNKRRQSSGEDNRLQSHCFSAILLIQALVEKRKAEGRRRSVYGRARRNVGDDTKVRQEKGVLFP